MQQESAELTAWIASIRSSSPVSLRLFCFPFAGGGASIYFPWVKRFAPTIDIYAVKLPGRESRIRERPFTQMAPLADAATAALLPYFQEPFAFFGHSMGAILSFEIARRLQRLDRPGPRILIVSGSPAPHGLRRTAPLFGLCDAELINKLRDMNGTPAEVLEQPELVRLFLPALRADLACVETYVYEKSSPLACPLLAIAGAEDIQVLPEEVKSWRKHTSNNFSCHLLPGGHFFLLDPRCSVFQVILEHLGMTKGISSV